MERLRFDHSRIGTWMNLLGMALLVVVGQAQAKSVPPSMYRVLYAGDTLATKGWPIDDGLVTSTLRLDTAANSPSFDSSVPWYPRWLVKMPMANIWLPRWVQGGAALTALYRDDAASLKKLGSDSSAGLFAHLRWNSTMSASGKARILFHLNFSWDTDEDWTAQDTNGDLNGVRIYLDSLNHLMLRTSQIQGKGSATIESSQLFLRNTNSAGLDDTTYSNFDTSLVRNGWVGLEAKFTKSSPDGVDVQLFLANRLLYTDTTHSSPVAKIPLPLTASGYSSRTREALTGLSLWGGFLGILGDAVAVGQCKAADSSYEFARKRFFTLERAVDSLGKVIPADTTTEPTIADILYAPPGNTSSVTLTKSSTLSSSYSTENDLSTSLTIGVGIDIEPEALTGENGVDAEVSATISGALNTGSSVDGSVTTSQGWTLGGGSSDQVIFDMLRLRGYVLRHPRLDKLLETGAINDSDFVAYRVVVPDPQKSLQCVPVADFVSTYGKDAVAMAHLDSVYVKNRSTGLVNPEHPLISGQKPVFVKYTGGTSTQSSGSVDVTTTKTLTESYTLGVGMAASLKLTAGSFVVSTSASLDVSHTVGKSSSASTEQGVAYSVSDNVPWDEFNYKYWIDPVYGNIVFEWDSSATYNGGYPSYSSAPWDGRSRKAVDLRYTYGFAEPTSALNSPLTCTLKVANATRYSPRAIASTLMPWIENSIVVQENGSGHDYTVSSDRTSAVKIDSNSIVSLVLTVTPPKDTLMDSIVLVVPHGYQNTSVVHVENDIVPMKLPARTTALAVRPSRAIVSHDLAASIVRSFAAKAGGIGAAQLGASASCDACQSVDVLLPSTATVQVSVFDVLGTPVISWSRDVSELDFANLLATSDGRRVLPVSWNGRALDGEPVSAGVYLWKIVVLTDDGRKLETVRKLGVK